MLRSMCRFWGECVSRSHFMIKHLKQVSNPGTLMPSLSPQALFAKKGTQNTSFIH